MSTAPDTAVATTRPTYPPTPLADRFNIYVTLMQPTPACTPHLTLIFDQQPVAPQGTTVWSIRANCIAAGQPRLSSHYAMCGELFNDSNNIVPKTFLGSFPREGRAIPQVWIPLIISRIIGENYLVPVPNTRYVCGIDIMQLALELQPFFGPVWCGDEEPLQLDGFESGCAKFDE
ncbi:hypothetical protein BDW74DRAFT_183881 [Aspergillus multicolor]|uniref:uncharacterized protein n=1 Tax=Aspergillus multicolor TaxID=41759 RepID=UPI003CCCD3A1